MPDTYVGAIDQGTTGTRFMVFDRAGRVVGRAYETHEQHYPKSGWVEHDPVQIWETTEAVVREGLEDAGVEGGDLAGVGIANQRETALLWEAGTGTPVANAIVWQDRRTTDRIEELEAAGKTDWIRETTGLEPDAYFSATKFEWLFDDAGEDLRERARDGEVLAGTVDAWLAYNLTSASAHVTDVTNASRTMLFDVRNLEWDDGLLSEFGVPRACLPDVRPSIDDGYYGHTDPEGAFGAKVPVAAALGDQQAALFGQTCFESGEAKNTTGTGSFVLMNTGSEPVTSEHGLLTTVAFQRSGESPAYALEGSIFVTGGAIEWLGDLSLVDDPEETERLATAVDSTDDVYVVPAFAGLGAPHWDGRARGTIVGLTRATRREHVVRATLEAIAFRTRDVVDAMEADADLDLNDLRVDGGAVGNDALCQFQADVLGTRVVRPVVDETTALGAAYAAGLATGYWDDREALREQWRVDREFAPDIDRETADRRYGRWEEAVERSLDWTRD